jgi:hypothetical protein
VRELCPEDRGEYVVREEGGPAMSEQTQDVRGLLFAVLDSCTDYDHDETDGIAGLILTALADAGKRIVDVAEPPQDVRDVIMSVLPIDDLDGNEIPLEEREEDADVIFTALVRAGIRFAGPGQTVVATDAKHWRINPVDGLAACPVCGIGQRPSVPTTSEEGGA